MVALVAFGCMLSTAFAGTVYYASPNGSSSNNGLSTNSPWPVSYAVGNAASGSTVMLMDGSYTTPIDIATPNLTVKAINKWGPKWLNVGSHAGSHDMVIQLSANNVTLDGVMCSNCQYEVGIEYYMTNCTIRNCWVTQTGNFGWSPMFGSASGIQTLPGLGHLVERCLVEYSGTNSTSGGNHGIYGGGTNCIYRNNVLRYNDGLGIILNSHGQGYDVGNQIYNNLMYGNEALNSAGGQIDLANDTQASYAQANQVFGNTLVSAGRGIAVQNMAAFITNNIIMSANNPILNNGAGQFTEDYNLSSVRLSGPHDITTSAPGFVNSNNGLYWIATNSTAYHMAKSTAYGPVDFFGNTQSSVADIGAFQFQPAYTSDSRVLDPSGSNPDYWANQTGTTKPQTPQGLHVLSETNLLSEAF
jgi:hypothetical protein